MQTKTATQYLIEHALSVVTINSSVGVEALLYGKRVITAGEAFYNINGLVSVAKNQDELRHYVQNLHKIPVNEGLRNRFLNYLAWDYFVPGNYHYSRHFTEAHFLSLRKK